MASRRDSKKTKGEFTGGGGLIQPEQLEHLSPTQEQWVIKASDPVDPRSPKPSDVGKLHPNGKGAD